MAKQNLNKHDSVNLVRLMDYSKYLYEQENQRNEKLTSATNIYLAVITFALTFLVGFLSSMYPGTDRLSLALGNWFQALLSVCLGISILLILLSLVFTMLVVKVRTFERLCNPKDFIPEASLLENDDELVGSIISHFVVATERNYLVNNKKAQYLAYGLQTYIVGFALLLFTLSGIYILGR